MKKVLLTSTALVMVGGAAFADGHAGVSVSGSAEFAVGDSGATGSEITFAPNIAISFAGSGETDGGLGFGFDYTTSDATGAHDHDGFFSTTSADGGGASGVDNWEVYLSGAFGKVVIGDPDNALQSVAGLGDIGFNGLGVDNRAEIARGGGSNSGLLYSNSFGPASIYLSSTMTPGATGAKTAAGVKFSAGDITVGIGMEEDAAGDNMAVDVSGSLGGIGFDVYYEDDDTFGSNYGTILSWSAGDTTINLGYADGESAAVGVGFSMDLGGGASLGGGVADNGSATAWDLGVSMSF